MINFETLKEIFGDEAVRELELHHKEAHYFWRQQAINLANERYSEKQTSRPHGPFETGFLTALEIISELYPAIKVSAQVEYENKEK